MFGSIPINKSTPNSTPGKDGQDIELQATESYIQWRYKGYRQWIDLISIKALIGPQGPVGATGTPGPQGEKGDQGSQGVPGEQGIKGDPGIQGKPGKVGPQGIQGKSGKDGLDGLDGKDGINGREIELQTSSTHIQWRYKGDILWKNLIAIEKLRGPKGDKGTDGEKGERGERGVAGYPGSQGPRGPQGYVGPAGPQGDPGAAGVGVPVGGTAGQVLSKIDGTDYNTQWVDQTGGGASSGYTLQQPVDYTSTYAYAGFQHDTDGSWFIYRRTRATNVRLYASGISDYATNWTNRASLTYS